MSAAGTFSKGIARIPDLAAMLGVERVVHLPSAPTVSVDRILGWGKKKNTRTARLYAQARGLPYLRLEDGFLRSVGLGVDGDPPLSIVVDDAGIYYDARRESQLERWLRGIENPPTSLDDPALLARAEALLATLRSTGVSKYNDGASRSPLPATDRERVLVVDQTAGDLSLALGLADGVTLASMVEAALAEHPHAEVVVKAHPDVVRGARRGEVAALAAHPRVRIVDAYVQPAVLLREATHVYTRTSQMGFEALWYGCAVHCFGAPFYAGWGLTDDRVRAGRRGRVRSLTQLVAASLILYPRYLDPETGEATTPERIVDHLALQRSYRSEDPAPTVCLGFSPWKTSFVGTFLGVRRGDVKFVSTLAARVPRRIPFVGPGLRGPIPASPSVGSVVAWSSKDLGVASRLAATHSAPLIRMEDGFLRSVGLGSDLVAPLSLVLDRTGIYYDPTRPSDLELILAQGTFTDAERARAAALRARIVATGVSKYVLAEHGALPLDAVRGREVVLVVGQVEDDASIDRGCVGIRRNEDLLRRARESRPDAFVVYRPHPDVSIGGRTGAVHDPVGRGLADADATGVDLAACLALADEVHTLTSLVGFEALLRQKRVVVYGLPFYAGWGLTEDHERSTRRHRTLTLDELVAGVMLRYPRYVHPRSRAFTTPERVLDYLAAARAAGPTTPSRLRPWRRIKNLAGQARARLGRG